MIVNRYPLFRVFLLFCSGILLANFTDTCFKFFAAGLLLFAVSSLVLGYVKSVFHSYQNRWLFGLSVYAFFFFLGVCLSHLYSEKHFKDHLQQLPRETVFAEVELLEDPREKERSFGMQVELRSWGISRDSIHHTGTKMMLYLQKSRKAESLRYGDRILINTGLSELQEPQNPYEFDYRDYLNLKAVYAQAYADSSSWGYLSSGHGYAIIRYATDLRRYLMLVVDSWNLPATQSAVTKALLLGYRYEIDENTMKAYASAGAMHVLAVSGLHVGVVYLMTGYLLFFLARIKHGEIVKSMILVLLLWCFAMVTGLSASVVRASTMFTFVAFGTALRRHTSVYNTILASTMCLLFIKPTYLFEVGFQLSYAAVFGIVWMQPRIEELLKPRTKAVKWIWGITTVSLAAQLVTFPLGLYYFHQFPTLFLISNLIVIPLVIILMYLGLPLLVLGAFGVSLAPLISVYSWFLSLMNKGVLMVERQVGFLITEIHITRTELVLLYILIIAGFWWAVSGGYRKLVIALSMLVFLGVSQAWEVYDLNSNDTLTVYSVKKHTAVGVYGGEESVFLADSTLLTDDDAMTFHVKHHWWALDATPNLVCIEELKDNRSRLFKIGDKLVYMLHEGDYYLPEVDYVLVSKAFQVKSLMAENRPTLILDSSLSFYQKQKWKDWSVDQGLSFYDVGEEGSLTLTSRANNHQ